MEKIGSILAVVPARGGSKGIPLKNLQKIRGKSLIEHVAAVVQQLPEIDVAMVSTDHDAIAAEAKRCGLAVPFRRPPELSGDLVSDLQVLQHAIAEAEASQKKKFDYVVMLQPTCPLRTPAMVRDCFRLLAEKKADAVWTVSPVDVKFHPLKQLRLEAGELRYVQDEGKKIIARQQLAETYIRNGACYLWRRSALIERQEILPALSFPLVVRERLVNIDTLEDLRLAEELYVPA